MSSVYERFIAANEALFACMQSVSEADYKEMTPSAQETVCRAEGEAVAEFLRNDSIAFRNLAAERLNFLKAAQTQQ